MKFNVLLLALVLVGQFVNAQGINRGKMDPQTTEVWEPIPPKVNIVDGVPSDAIVLFDGQNLDSWVSTNSGDATWDIIGDAMQVKPQTGGIKTKESFGDCQLHIEWTSPTVIKGEGQGRGNSGIFLMSKYELQVLDSYESRTYSNGQASGIYKQTAPLVNACLPPGEWQTYDIIFKAPIFNDKGVRTHAATITVLHNGVVTQHNTEIWGTTEYMGLPQNNAHGDLPIMLQDHGDLVKYRNIWVRKL
ncbi:3-keto-disaccharide hydrolase [Portibacter lacus]|uniref:Endo-1,3-1,4-beta glucanase-related protein n=1 Tax=Portibacter lacus TaxID=1099794 RepID=A0AA37SYK8_9BACT|nr:DUF1080 domain-containing protein [Portibacter lacus]GLR20088.1 endo-1,3-1,4-beta glucanase-related protein [Portibacter lacus]